MISLPHATKRCLLRLLGEEDVPDYHSLQSDAQVMRFLGGPTKRTVDHYKHRFANITPGLESPLAITRKDSGEFLGRCGFTHDVCLEGWEVNVVLARHAWRQGFASEVVSALLDIAFSGQRFSLFGVAHPENAGSLALLGKFGFERQPHIRYYRWGVETHVYAKNP